MTANEIMQSEDFQKCEIFHGHVCPGLAIGYQASKLALSNIAQTRASDEEVVAIVENDACCVDAIQVLTGCTFGKGNFIFKDHGKMVFTFFSRNTGQGIRISLLPGVLEPGERHRELIDRIRENSATPGDKEEFKKLHEQRTVDILENPPENLFKIEKTKVTIPDAAKIEPSKPCEKCGEPVMPSKMTLSDGSLVCRECLDFKEA